MLVRTQVDGFSNRVLRSRGGLWFPALDVFAPTLLGKRKRANVWAIVQNERDRTLRRELVPAANIVTTTGNVYYAQKGAGETATNVFGIWELTTGRESSSTVANTDNRSNYDTLVIASTQVAHTSGYPKTNDADADNAGPVGTSIVTRRVFYSGASFSNAAITHGFVTNTSPGASEPLLACWQFSSAINKTTSDSLTIFLNHTILGV